MIKKGNKSHTTDFTQKTRGMWIYMKKITSIILVFVMAISLIACGSKESDEKPTNTPAITNTEQENGTSSEENEANTNPTSTDIPVITETPSVTETPVVTEAPEPEDVEFIPYIQGSAETSRYDDNFVKLASISVPFLHLTDDYSEKYSLVESIFKSLTDAFSKGADNLLTQLKDAAVESINKKDDDTDFKNFYDDISATVIRSDSLVTSFLMVDSSYVGENEYKEYNAYNINTKTGGFLSLSDVFTDGSKLRRALTNKIKEDYPDIKFFLLEDNISASIAEGSLNFVVGYDNVTFYFNPNTIALPEYGPIIVSLDFASNSDYIKNILFNVPEEYSFMPQLETPYYLDVDGDGSIDKLELRGTRNEYGDVEKIAFYINELSVLEQDIFASYDINTNFVHTAEGKSYIYIDTTYLSDDKLVYGFAIKDGNIVYLGDVAEAFESFSDNINDLYYWAHYALQPNKVEILTRSDLVSTCMVKRTYKIGVDGQFVPVDEFYSFTYKPEITAKTEIGVQFIDEAGNVTGEGSINSGDTITAIRLLDNLSTCDFTMVDGTWIRIAFDNDYFGTINDVPVYELFDNVMFAD